MAELRISQGVKEGRNAQTTLTDCIFEGLMEIKRLEKKMVFPKNINSDIPFASSFLAGWIQESIENQTVEIPELKEERKG